MAVVLQLLQLLLVIRCSWARSGATPLSSLPSHCYCSKMTPQQLPPPAVRVDKRVGQYATLHCCSRELAPTHPNATVAWTYNGKPFPWSRVDSQFGDEGCFPEEVGARYVVPRDRGNYTCTYSLPGGEVVSRTIVLVVHKSSGKSPLIAAISNNTLVRKGDSVTLFCTAYTGGHRVLWGPSSVGWWAYTLNGSMVPAELVPGISVQLSPKSEDGMYTTKLHIRAMSAAMYGVYTCMASNLHNYTLSNVTLQQGVPPPVARAEAYQAATVVVVACVVVALLFMATVYRLRLTIALAFRSDSKEPGGRYTNDVFIVHGETSTDWVVQELVRRLETVHRYTCYLPARDLHGGADLVDELPRQLVRSRRVVVVVTSCLLHSPWPLWCLEQALHAALCRGTRLVAVMLQNLEEMDETPTSARLVSRIHLIKKIWHPSCKAPKKKAKLRSSKVNDGGTPHSGTATESTNCLPQDVNALKNEDLHCQPLASVSYKCEDYKVCESSARHLTAGFLAPQPASDHHLDKQGTQVSRVAKKTKSDLYLNLPDRPLDPCMKSSSLQHQRLQNMVSSTRAFGDCLHPSTSEAIPETDLSSRTYKIRDQRPLTPLEGSPSHEMSKDAPGLPPIEATRHRGCDTLHRTTTTKELSPSEPRGRDTVSQGTQFTKESSSTFFATQGLGLKLCGKLGLNSHQFGSSKAAEGKNEDLCETEQPLGELETCGSSPSQLDDAGRSDIKAGLAAARESCCRGPEGTYSEATAPYRPALQRGTSLDEATVPDTPCSGTPFILPERDEVRHICKARRRDATVLGAVWLCCSSLLTQTPQQRFWQRLLLQLPAVPLASMSPEGGVAP